MHADPALERDAVAVHVDDQQDRRALDLRDGEVADDEPRYTAAEWQNREGEAVRPATSSRPF